MNALSINIPANFAADCNNTLKRYDAERRDGAGRKPCLFCQFDPGEPALGEQCLQNQAAVLLLYCPQAGFFHSCDSFQTPLSSLISDYEISTVYRITRCLGYIKTYFGFRNKLASCIFLRRGFCAFFFPKSVGTCSVSVTRSHTLWDALIPGLFTYFRPLQENFLKKH